METLTVVAALFLACTAAIAGTPYTTPRVYFLSNAVLLCWLAGMCNMRAAGCVSVRTRASVGCLRVCQRQEPLQGLPPVHALAPDHALQKVQVLGIQLRRILHARQPQPEVCNAAWALQLALQPAQLP